MRYKIIIALFFMLVLYKGVNSQVCPNETDLNNTNVCGVYGDGNGNSNWDWELNDPTNSNYCRNWYARTSPTGFLTRMGSPFVNPGTGKLKIISDNYDFIRQKGWELLQRKFGCQSDITNPYFILYNKYTGIMRVYVYLGSSNYSQLLMTIKSVYDHRPATLSSASDIMYAPDKYLANQVGTSNDEIIMSLNESVGTNQWAVSEFYMMLDDHIAETVFANGSFEIKLYGVTTSTLEADIEGSSCTTPPCGGAPVKDAAFKPKNISTNGNTFNFTATGEKLLSLSKSFSTFLNGVKDNSTKIANTLYPNTSIEAKSVLQKFGKFAKFVSQITADSSDFAKQLNRATNFLGLAGNILKFAGTMVGFLRGGENSSSSPAYTSYNFKLKGSISAQVVVQNIVLKIPGTSTPPTNSNNATYYTCPLGVFNLKKTPTVDSITYDRRALMPQSYNPKSVPKTIKYSAYRIHENIEVEVNAGAGMTVLSVEGALMAKVNQPVSSNPDPNFTVWIDPLENYPRRGNYTFFNHMRADIEANRLEITHYDSDYETYHIIQTPFYPIQCISNASMNIHVPVMKMFLRLRATLKRADGVGEAVYFIKDYEVDKRGPLIFYIPPNISTDLNAIPPFSNYTIPPNISAIPNPGNGNVTPSVQDFIIGEFNSANFSQPEEVRRNHIISTSSNNYVTVSSQEPLVTFRAGSSVTLNPKFMATYGSVFLATVDWGNTSLACYPQPNIVNYIYPGNCYTGNIFSQRSKNVSTNESNDLTKAPQIYPNPATNLLSVKLNTDEVVRQIQIIDISGKVLNMPYKSKNNRLLEIDIANLKNGFYTIIISTESGVISSKFIVLK
jgi:hypothetical protein